MGFEIFDASHNSIWIQKLIDGRSKAETGLRHPLYTTPDGNINVTRITVLLRNCKTRLLILTKNFIVPIDCCMSWST
jgi:hypothetical protein